MLSIKKITKLLLTCAAVLAIILFCLNQPSVFDYIFTYNWRYIVALSGLYCIFYILNAYILFFLIHPYGKNITFIKVLGVNQLSSFVNYLLPFRVASVGIKIFLLKRLFGVSTGTTIGTFTLSAFLFSTICMCALLYSLSFLQSPPKYLINFSEATYLVVSIIIVFIFLLIIENRFQLLGSIYLPQIILDLKKSILSINKRTLFLICLLYIMQVLITSYITYVLFLGANYSISFLLCIFITSVGNISGILALTPANIGIKEISYVGVGALFGVPADIIIALLLLDRVIQASLLTIGLPFFSYLNVEK